MKTIKRLFWILLPAFLVALIVLPAPLAAQNSAYGDIVDPRGPRPINVLPSVIKGTLPVAASAQSNYLAVMLYRFSKSPAFWNAVAAQQAGTATTAQIATVTAETASHRVPATKLATLGRVVGGVGVAVSGYEVGTMIGGPAGDALAVALYGKTAEDLICSQGDASVWLGILTATDCTAAMQVQSETYVPNSDVEGAGQLIWEPVCHPTNGTCITFRGTVFWNLNVSTPMTTRCAVVALGNGQSGIVGFTVTPIYPKVGGGEINAGTITYPGNGSTYNKCAQPDVNAQNSTSTSASQIAGEATRLSINFDGTPQPTQYPEVVPADPARQIRCVLLLDGGGTAAGSWSDPFYASEGVIPSPVCPEIPLGATFAGTEVQELVNGEVRTLSTELVTPEWAAGQQLAPECSDGTCLLDLRKDDVSCFQTPDACLGWFADPNKETTYSCHYGIHLVDLAECTVYAPAFEPGSVSTGDTLGDPSTGDTLGAPAGSAPGSDSATFGAAVQDPHSERECFPTGWAVLNPVEWVMKPVQCALEWAFVPRPEVIEAAATTASMAWDDTMPGQVPGLVGGLVEQVPTSLGSSCQGPPVIFGPELEPFGLGGTHYPLNACEEPYATLAAISRFAFPATLAITGLLAVVRYAAATVGYVGIGKGEGGSE